MFTLQLRQLDVPPGHRVLLHDVSWQEFELILEDLGERRANRLAYYQGTLEIVAPWKIATGRKTEEDLAQYYELLERNKEGALTPTEQLKLAELRSQADLFMMRKAHAAALLHWRGYRVPNA